MKFFWAFLIFGAAFARAVLAQESSTFINKIYPNDPTGQKNLAYCLGYYGTVNKDPETKTFIRNMDSQMRRQMKKTIFSFPEYIQGTNAAQSKTTPVGNQFYCLSLMYTIMDVPERRIKNYSVPYCYGYLSFLHGQEDSFAPLLRMEDEFSRRKGETPMTQTADFKKGVAEAGASLRAVTTMTCMKVFSDRLDPDKRK
ncbi:MAG: hypothetical protein LBU87_00080 [Lactobacillales bacterium]|jgi:NADH:ubiquinone oxidoreductase subunit 3 (subunit A)|nr:hypothetical protein [Lactobacillales bacterium]